MTRSSRILNRVILLLLGLAAIAVGALFAVPGLVDRVAWPDPADPTVLWIAAAAAALLAVVAVTWIATPAGAAARAAPSRPRASTSTSR